MFLDAEEKGTTIYYYCLSGRADDASSTFHRRLLKQVVDEDDDLSMTVLQALVVVNEMKFHGYHIPSTPVMSYLTIPVTFRCMLCTSETFRK